MTSEQNSISSPPTLYNDTLSNDEFRLIQIELPLRDHNDADGEISASFRLEKFTLDDCPDYQCVSYAWLEPLTERAPIDTSILVNDIAVSVQANLAWALRQHVLDVRQNSANDDDGDDDVQEAPWLWIDAICINQKDLAERNAQVAVMHRIYRQAWKVLVWLGPDPDEEAHHVREFFRALLQRFWISDDGTPNYPRNFLYEHREQSLLDAGLPSLDAEIWPKTVLFWDRAWFGRSWVQQEVVLAQQVEIWCGRVMFTANELEQASRFYVWSGLGSTLLPLRAQFLNGTSISEGTPLGDGFYNYSIIRSMLAGESPYEHEMDQRLADRIVGSASEVHDGRSKRTLLRIFVCMLRVAVIRHATDERDKVFALLVLMREMAAAYGFDELPLRADYAKPIEMVLQETTAYIIEASGWVSILGFINQRRKVDDDASTKVTPSWVVDIRSNKPSKGIALLQERQSHGRRLEQAHKALNSTIRPSVQDSMLTISVAHIGTVQAVGDEYQAMFQHGHFEQTARLLLDCLVESHEPRQSRIDWWIHTCIGVQSRDPCSAEVRADFGRWIRAVIVRALLQENGQDPLQALDHFVRHQPAMMQLAAQDVAGVLPTEVELRQILSSEQLMTETIEYSPSAWGPKSEILELHGRRFVRLGNLCSSFADQSCLLGIGPDDAKVGDEVYLVAGSLMPLLLRRQSGDHSGSQTVQRFRFVGEVYVNGAGEPWEVLDIAEWERACIV